MTNTQAHTKGYTKAITADGGPYTLSLLVKPDADLDSRFTAFDVDASEFIAINGWLFTTEEGH